jgi:hypothetical protein
MPFEPGCGHKWESLEARQYRCEWCGVRGYSQPTPPGARRPQERIFVYVCDVRGCKGAVVSIRDGKKRCRRHV